MTHETTERSAKIYQFPVGGRTARREEKKADYIAEHVATIGSSWYHDEAINDAKRANER